MFKSTIKNLTISYIIIITIITTLISTFVYFTIVKSTSEILKNEEIKVVRRFGYNDIKTIKRLQFAEESIADFQKEILLILVSINIVIIVIVGFFSYLLAKKNIQPIEISARKQKEFISNISHELKTPLTSLKSSFEIELRSKNPNLKRTLESGIEDVDKMNTLINGFLRLSSLENNSYKQKNEELNLKDLLDEIIMIHKDEIINKRIEIIYNLKEKNLYTDKFLIRELLSILISNSIKFNKIYGKIIVSSLTDSNLHIIKIKDTGEGIEKSKLERIFDRFYKIDESRSKEGYGIGLAIAKEILSIYKAKIDVKTKVNEGTEITIKFSEIFQK